MYRPRKTIDFEEEKSNQPQTSSRKSRISRLTTTRQTTHSNNVRQSTVQATSSAENASASKQQRPSRSKYATPLRTPQSRSSSAHKNTGDKDHRTPHEQAAAIQEKLQAHPDFSAELLPTGLRSITTKQFVATVSFFMKSIIGNGRGNRIANVSTDDIAQWLTQIHYPHMQSRSWLKTPNVPHAFSHLIELMQWLSHFMPDNPEDPMPTFRKPQYYINDHMSNAFFDVVRETFILWNNNQDEDRQKKNQDRLVDEYIQMRIGVASAKEVGKETKKIKAQIATLHKECNAVCPKQTALLESQQAKHKLFKQDQKRLMDNLHDKQLLLQRLRSELKANTKQNVQLDELQGRLKVSVKGQSLSKAEFNKLLEECAEKRNQIKAKRESIAHLKDIEYNKHLNYSRRLKQQTDAVSKLNMFIHEMAEILHLSNYQGICVDTKQSVFEINQHLPSVLRALEETIVRNRSTLAALNVEASKQSIDLAKINAEVRTLQSDLAEMTKGCQAQHERRTQLESTIGLTGSEKATCLKQMTQYLEELQQEIAGRLGELVEKRGTSRELYKEHERLLEQTERDALLLIAEKERRIDGFCMAVSELKRVCVEIGLKREDCVLKPRHDASKNCADFSINK